MKIAVEKAFNSINETASLTDNQRRIVEQHLSLIYAAGYDEAMKLAHARPRPVEQWYRPKGVSSEVLIKKWRCCEDAAKELRISHALISKAAHGKIQSRKYKGYIWRYY